MWVAALAAIMAAAPPAARAPERLSARFLNDLVIVDAPLRRGDRIRFLTDSGGGGTILLKSFVARRGWPTRPYLGDADDVGPDARLLDRALPLAPSGFPPPPPPILVVDDAMGGVVPPIGASDGNIGQTWFAGHVWTWDYPRGTLTLEPDDWRPTPAAHAVAISFRAASPGRPALHFARITVTIAGEATPMLLDTGATTYLTPEAQRVIGGGRLRATSMIVESRIAAWRKAHPEWPYIAHGQNRTGSAMIRVPQVAVAGFEVGPVWFTSRPDANFHDNRNGMSSMTAGPVEGAIGGNAFHPLRMTVDYLHGRAAFSR